MEGVSESSLLQALLAAERDVPALVLRGRQVQALNPAARTLLGAHAQPGAAVERLFASSCHARLHLALSARVPSAWELVPRGPPHAPPLPLRFLSLPALSEGGSEPLTVLVGDAQGARLLSELAVQVMHFNAELSLLTRELSRRSHELEEAHTHLATLAHDIRSPLNAIGLNAGRIVREVDPTCSERVASRAAAIERIIGRTQVLIQNVLDAERLHADQVELHLEPLPLGGLLQELGDTFEPITAQAGVRLALPEDAEVGWVRADRGRLQQVLGNLVDNAVRHSPQGGQVSLEVLELGGRVRCHVRDQGPGVPAEQRERIFGLYEQGGAAARQGSAGLGLYIASRLVSLHGGRLWVEDSPPHGALFVLELPAARFVGARRGEVHVH